MVIHSRGCSAFQDGEPCSCGLSALLRPRYAVMPPAPYTVEQAEEDAEKAAEEILGRLKGKISAIIRRFREANPPVADKQREG